MSSDTRHHTSLDRISTTITTSQNVPSPSSTSTIEGGTGGKGLPNETTGIIVGVLGVVATLFGVYYARKAIKKRSES